MSLMVIALMVMTVFLVGCATEEVTDEDFEEQVAEMTAEELETVVEGTEDNGALAGQAVRVMQKKQLMASKELINRTKAEAKVVDLFEHSSVVKLVENGKVSAVIKVDLPGVNKDISGVEFTETISEQLGSNFNMGGLIGEGDWCCESTGDGPVKCYWC